LFLTYVTFAFFAVVNIVTGVFVEGAMQASQGDLEVLIHEEMNQKNDYLSSLKTLLNEMDRDGDGLISLDELKDSLKDSRVNFYLHALQLDLQLVVCCLENFELSESLIGTSRMLLRHFEFRAASLQLHLGVHL